MEATGTGKEYASRNALMFSSGLSSKPFENICVAGLLTCFRYERLPNFRQWHKRIAQSVYEAYSSGTVRDLHPIPF
jgi:hypothetical protein